MTASTLSSWITPDTMLTVVGGGVALTLLWSWIKWRYRIRVPQRAVITICILLSIAAHIPLLMILPRFLGNGHGAAGTTGHPEATPLVYVPIEENATPAGGSALVDPLLTSPRLIPTVAIPLPDPEPEVADTPATSPVMAPTLSLDQDVVVAASQSVDALLSSLLLPDAARASMEPEPSTTEATNRGGDIARETSRSDSAPLATSLAGVPVTAVPTATTAAEQPVPNDFANRQAAARWHAVVSHGGDEHTEAAVEAALAFLSATQEPDGRWSAARHGAGREENVLGHSRGGTGRNADNGVTGLALLAMLGRGVNYEDATYGNALRRGLIYLRATQMPDGSLSGNADTYARMYCHGIASLAVAEAYAITRDPAMRDTARAALAYTARSQHPTTGGWRYTPGDQGDMSQFGWQAMALQTGQWAGLPIPAEVRPRMQTFLSRVRGGRAGGLASYRVGERPTASMTAEALACYHLLQLPISEAAAAEAEAMLMSELPGASVDNSYYWYYASLALHQRGGAAWQRFNEAMKHRLVTTQSTDGSWSGEMLWGGYGGRIYTTSIATLCLEVYYRHLSIYRGGPTSVAQNPDAATRTR